jgi:hypothetical protein
MDKELKITAVGKDGLVRLGSDQITLTGKARVIFTTDNLDSFLTYLSRFYPANGDIKQSVYFTESGLVSMPDIAEYNGEAFAHCNLNETPYLKLLRSANGKKHSPVEFETLLKQLREFWEGKEPKEIYDFTRNIKISRVTKIDQTKDGQGNFHFNVTRESSGKEDFACADSIGFSVQLFQHIPEVRKLTFDMFFDFAEVNGSVQVVFWFELPNLAVKIQEYAKEIITARLEKEPDIKALWGSLEIKSETDKWKYQENALKIYER